MECILYALGSEGEPVSRVRLPVHGVGMPCIGASVMCGARRSLKVASQPGANGWRLVCGAWQCSDVYHQVSE